MIDEIELLDRVEQVAVAVERQPRMKGDEGGHERQTRLAAARDRVDEILAGVSLVEQTEHGVVDRFDGARHEEAARGGETRKQLAMTQAGARP